MKLENGKMGLTLRLGAMIVALLVGQQAMAIGTAAGTSVVNTATVDYRVGLVDQTAIDSNTVEFVVDRRVDFDLTEQGGALVDVTPGETDAFFDFLLTNDSNSELDFTLDLNELVGGLVRGATDDANMQTVDYAVSAFSVNDPGPTPDPDPVRNGPQWVDELAADDSIRIRVFGDAAFAMINGQVAGVQLDAIAGEPGTAGVEGGALVEIANTDLGIENVFAEDGAGGDGVQVALDGFTVISANLAVSKSYSVIAGDLGSGLPIPGATVEYVVEVINSTATPATNIVITDTIDGTVVLNLNVAAYGGEDIQVVNGALPALPCDLENNTDGDGCDLVGADVTVGDLAEVTITIAGNSTLTLTYQVTIPDPDPTP